MEKEILPRYIQKYFIKIVCNHINYYCKNVDPNLIGITYREMENGIKSMLLNFSLVSKLWLKMIQSNIYVSVDFNFLKLDQIKSQLESGRAFVSKYSIFYYKNDQEKLPEETKDCKSGDDYSIIKIDNVKVLKLHYDQTFKGSGFYRKSFIGPPDESSTYRESYKGCKSVDIEIPRGVANEIINRMKSLEKLVIRNVNTIYGTLSFLNDENGIYIPESIKKVKLLEINISDKTKEFYIEYVHKRVAKLHSVVVTSFNVINILKTILNNWSTSVKQLFIITIENQIPFNQLCGNILNISYTGRNTIIQQALNDKVNYLKNIEYFDFQNTFVSFKDLYCILKATPKLEYLKIEICVKKLNHIFDYHFNSSKNDQPESKCNCMSLINFDDPHGGLEDGLEDDNEEELNDGPFSNLSFYDDSDESIENVKQGNQEKQDKIKENKIKKGLEYFKLIINYLKEMGNKSKLKYIKIKQFCNTPTSSLSDFKISTNALNHLKDLFVFSNNLEEIEFQFGNYNVIPLVNSILENINKNDSKLKVIEFSNFIHSLDWDEDIKNEIIEILNSNKQIEKFIIRNNNKILFEFKK